MGVWGLSISLEDVPRIKDSVIHVRTFKEESVTEHKIFNGRYDDACMDGNY